MRKILSFLGIAAILAIQMPLTYGQTFSDVNSSTTYETAIEFLASLDIVEGFPDGTFRPNASLTRAEMLKFAIEARAEINSSFNINAIEVYGDDKCFPDVAPNMWYTKYICFAKAQNWVKGYPDGNFRPDEAVNVVEALKIALGAAGIPYGTPAAGEPWYKPIVDAASARNYIPFTIDSFGALMLRGEMSDLVTRIIKDNQGQLLTYLGTKAEVVVTYNTIQAGLDLSQFVDVDLNGDAALLIDEEFNFLVTSELECAQELEITPMAPETNELARYAIVTEDDDTTLAYYIIMNVSTYNGLGPSGTADLNIVAPLEDGRILIYEEVSSPAASLTEIECANSLQAEALSGIEGNVIHTVTINSAGNFSPEILTIEEGDSVLFFNEDDQPHWPASDPHPDHDDYPTTGGCIGSTFDACENLSTDEGFIFTFDISGTWDYHDHLNPTVDGTIIVEED